MQEIGGRPQIRPEYMKINVESLVPIWGMIPSANSK